jgi:uncharacterized protein (DUF58 family)
MELSSKTTAAPQRMRKDEAAGGDDGVVRIGLAALVELRRAAKSLSLQHGRVRAAGVGGYQSTFKGRGMEFDEVRPYSPGDDARTLDWRVTARTGKPYTKLFREERERPVMLWVDLCAPMFFATQGAYKAVRAAQAAALIGWCAAAQGDRVGALLVEESSHQEFEPKRGRVTLLHVLRALADRTAVPHSHDAEQRIEVWSQSLLRLRRVAQPGSLVVLLSDFASLDKQGSAHIAQLARHSEVLWIQIDDPLEMELPGAGDYRVTDGRRFVSLSITDAMRSRYRETYLQRQQEQKQFCRQYGIKLISLTTRDEPLAALQQRLGFSR